MVAWLCGAGRAGGRLVGSRSGAARHVAKPAAHNATPAQPSTPPPGDSSAPNIPFPGEEEAPRPTEVGYIDVALPLSMFRLRFSAAYDNNRPDRAEFFYAQYQQQLISSAPGSPIYVNTPPSGGVTTSGGGGAGGGGGTGRGGSRDIVTISQPGQLIGNPAARGLPKPETRIDYQDITGYLEWAPTNRFSAFVEGPYRFLNPELNSNTNGFADMNAGFKWAFLYTPQSVGTLQVRTYIPTGDSTRGLGTNHVSLEPSFLFNQLLTNRLLLEGQLDIWIPIGGTDFQGQVMQYGLGASYIAYQNNWVRLAPVVEMMGWTVLNGKETAGLSPTTFSIRTAGGDSIFNAKVGLRARFQNSDLYVGYGRALTGEVWYKNMMRVEFRLFF
jgi:hypothetical protein